MSYTDPYTLERTESSYEEDETFESKFGDISISYEECRAEMVALYLQILPNVYS